MLFHVVDKSISLKFESSSIYLVRDDWDDWGKFATMFNMIFIDKGNNKHYIGSIKIGQKGLKAGSPPAEHGKTRSPFLEDRFEKLNENYFSIGQSQTYYEELSQFPDSFQKDIFDSLKDIVWNDKLIEENKNEPVLYESLLRDTNSEEIEKYTEILTGECVPTEYSFSYKLKYDSDDNVYEDNVEINFIVKPKSIPPSNFHVLIGRNGVGKSKILKNIASLVNTQKKLFDRDESIFSKIIHVVFSIFDIDEDYCSNKKITILGIPKIPDRECPSKEEQVQIKSKADLSSEFVKSFENCSSGLRKKRFIELIDFFEYDDIFKEIDIKSMLEEGYALNPENHEDLIKIFNKLSSGHAIIILTLTQLVEKVDNKTLVLLDEPESHLHPPLLSAFIRAVSKLVIMRNAVVVCVTHSPIVLQEVPCNCAWKISRSGCVFKAERPSIETFGENVSALTREVFGLDVANTGYITLLKELINKKHTYDEIIGILGDQLGYEGKLILSNLIAVRDAQ